VIVSCAPPDGGSGASARERAGGGASDSFAARDQDEALFYLKGTRLHRLDLESRHDEVVANLHSHDVFASTTSPWLAYVTPETASGEDHVDFIESPTLHLFNLSTKRDVTVGPGLGALWGPDSQVAYLRPVGQRHCSGEVCSGRVEVVVRDASSGAEETLLRPGRWTLLGWSGSRVLVGDPRHPGRTLLVGEGRVSALSIPPSSLWAGSPDGRWLLTVGDGSARFVEVQEASASSPPRIPLSGGVLAEGAWSSDSTRVAAGLLDRRGSGSKLVVFGPGSAKPRQIGSVRPAGSVLWSPTMESVVAVAADGARGLRAVRCRTGGSPACSTLLRWKRGVVLLSVL
jgi:hypothetical protein